MSTSQELRKIASELRGGKQTQKPTRREADMDRFASILAKMAADVKKILEPALEGLAEKSDIDVSALAEFVSDELKDLLGDAIDKVKRAQPKSETT